MVADLRSDSPSEWEAMGRVADLLEIGTAETVRKWVRQAEIDAGVRARPYPTIIVAILNQRSSHQRVAGGHSQ